MAGETVIGPPPCRFAHPSEREFARILDFYGVRWRYEPHAFPLQWADDGRVTERFTPDFYLPDLDLFIELTTLKQHLVTKKNRKLRRLRLLYPGLNIKIFYGRDYRMLAFKYGMDPQASLTAGQTSVATPSSPQRRTALVAASSC